MKKYFLILLAVALIIVANLYYSHHAGMKLLLVNHSRTSIPDGTSIYYMRMKVGEVKNARSGSDGKEVAISEMSQGLCVGTSSSLAVVKDIPGQYVLKLVNNNIWDECLHSMDTVYIVNDDSLRNLKMQNLVDTGSVRENRFLFGPAIDSIRCYCWCMVDPDLDTSVKQNKFHCYTENKVSPADLVKPANYKLTITSKAKLQLFQDMLASGQVRRYDLGFDARFAFVLYTREHTDTITLYSHHYLGLGNSQIIVFDDDITDDLNGLLGDLGIDCTTKGK